MNHTTELRLDSIDCAHALDRVKARIAKLSRDLRASQAGTTPGPTPIRLPRAKPVPRPRAERKPPEPKRQCDECHRRLGVSAFSGDTETCIRCETELATPRVA